MLYLVLFVYILFPICSYSETPRIQNFSVDRKKVNKLLLSYSKVNKIRFPDPIDEVLIGLNHLYTHEISKRNSHDLNMRLTKGVKSPTNMIVSTTNHDVYVFDLVPRNNTHQDFIIIDGSFYKSKLSLHKEIKIRKIFSNSKKKRIKITDSERQLVFSNKISKGEK